MCHLCCCGRQSFSGKQPTLRLYTYGVQRTYTKHMMEVQLCMKIEMVSVKSKIFFLMFQHLDLIVGVRSPRPSVDQTDFCEPSTSQLHSHVKRLFNSTVSHCDNGFDISPWCRHAGRTLCWNCGGHSWRFNNLVIPKVWRTNLWRSVYLHAPPATDVCTLLWQIVACLYCLNLHLFPLPRFPPVTQLGHL